MDMTLDGLGFWLTHPVVQTMGWVLVHFIWQGALVAGALAGALALLRAEQARLRYALSFAALVMLMALPVATWLVLSDAAPTTTGEASFDAVPAAAALLVAEAPSDAHASSWVASAQDLLAAGLPWLVAGWLAGVSVLALRLLGGWVYTLRLRGAHAAPVASGWQQRTEALARRLGVRSRVHLRQSARIEVPMAVGWLCPVVLMPVSVFAGLPPEQVEALIAHELAHIRRHDVLVGRLQAVAETLLFYHPAVWWVSRQLRVEREHCCDDRVVEALRDRVSYARALTMLAARHVAPPVGAMTATDGALLARIRRLVGPAAAREDGGTRSSVSVALLVLAVGLVVTGMQLSAPVASSEGHTNRAALMPWVTGGTMPADTTEERTWVVRRTLRDTIDHEGVLGRSAPHPEGVWFRSDSTGDFAILAPGMLDSLDQRIDVFVRRHLAGLDTIPLPPVPDAPFAPSLDSLSVARPPLPPGPPVWRVFGDTIDVDMLRHNLDSLRAVWPRLRAPLDSLDRARIDSLRREAREQWHVHREDLQRIMQERREEIGRLHRKLRERMHEEHPERLREQAERLRHQAERLEEQARELEEQEAPTPEEEPDREGNG